MVQLRYLSTPLRPLEFDFNAVQLVPSREVVNVSLASVLVKKFDLLLSVYTVVSEGVVTLDLWLLQFRYYFFGSFGHRCDCWSSLASVGFHRFNAASFLYITH